MRRILHLLASVALAAFVAPTARLMMVSLHVALDDHHEHGDTDHAGEVEASFHGHDHEGAWGNHEHALVTFQPAAHRTWVLDVVAFPVRLDLYTDRIRETPDRRWAPRTRLNDHGPPDPVTQGILLRV